MKEDEKRTICKNWVYLIKNLIAKDLTKYFIAKMILTLDDDEKIRSFSTLNDQNDEFLKTINRKGVNSFGTLIYALREENDDYTAELLENSLRDERAGRPQSMETYQTICEARCPQCHRLLVCPDCSPLYDEGYSGGPRALSSSYPPHVIHKVKTFPGTEISSRNTPVYNSSIADVTLPKTLYTRSGDYTGYEPLSFDDNVRKQDSHQVHYGLDYPDCRLPQQPESVQAQGRNSENLAAEMSDRESEKNDKSAYANESIDQGYVDQGYENVSPDNKRIELKSALELPQEELTVNPIAEKDKHFQYYQNHLCHEKGWYPAAYSIEDIEKLLKDNYCTQTSQYLIWYEATRLCKPFISVHCQGIIHHFCIEMLPRTDTKKKVFYIDSKYEFHTLEELLDHVKRYGISLDKEFRPEAGLF